MSPLRLSAAAVRRWIPRRPPDSHKGFNGHVLVIAGSRGMSGAAALSTLGALRAGAGLVTTALVTGERAAVAYGVPEALTLPLPESQDGSLAADALAVIQKYIAARRIRAVALGPGLSTHAGARTVVRRLLPSLKIACVLDADGLNNLRPAELRRPRGGPLVVTPHPGEFARLFGGRPDARPAVRLAAARQAARRYGLVCVLKGRGTVISDGKRTHVNPTGNAAMAAGGMGDVLTGVIAGFLAQGLPAFEAACAGVYLHGLAADIARISDRGLLAGEVAFHLPHALRKIGVRG